MKKIIRYEVISFASVVISKDDAEYIKAELPAPTYTDGVLGEHLYSADRENYAEPSECLNQILTLCDEQECGYFRIEEW